LTDKNRHIPSNIV